MIFGVCVNVGASGGRCDVIYVSGITVVRFAESEEIVEQIGNLVQA